jgi:hypothetical protein
MKQIPIKNKQLIAILDMFTSEMMKIERGEKLILSNKKRLTPEYATSNEYLAAMQAQRSPTGFPEETLGTDFGQQTEELVIRNRIPQSFADAVYKMDRQLIEWSGSRFNAVKMYYPEGGYMGWHHNANCPGYNVLLSWSEGGTGYFRYQDPSTKEIVTMPDSPGWTAKVGYYGSFKELDKIYWHSASAHAEERMTLGYVIPHEGMWEDMCDDIQGL